MSYAQTRFIRVTDLTIGSKDSGNFKWGTTNPQSLLIKIDDNAMVIHSDNPQIFKVIAYEGQYENGVNRWRCTDENNIICYIYISSLDPKTDSITVGISHNNLFYYYRGWQFKITPIPND
jgi:hypothetical protein